LQRLWIQDYEGVWGPLAYSWPSSLQGLIAALRTQLQEKTLFLMQRAYANISVSNLSRILGVSEQDTAAEVAQRGWEVQENGLIIPAPPAVGSAFEPSEADLQKIAQYVVFLQAGQALPSSAAAAI
jgi:CSN8/PSMD8/EIF3K family